MRLLVLDGSRLLASLVRHLLAEPVEIEEAHCFEEAMDRLRDHPPDALIANVTPAELPWRELKRFCQRHDPQIPVLFESCVYRTPFEAGIGDLNHSAAFLPKPYDLEALRLQLARLFADRDDLDLDLETTETRPRP